MSKTDDRSHDDRDRHDKRRGQNNDHHHHDGHDHHHGPGHVHAPANFGRAFAVAAALNIALVVAQVVYGLLANSVALLADAGHNFGDVLGLVMAWGAHSLARQRPTGRYTYGLRSASILTALLNSLILLVATGAIAWEAVRRFFEPGEVAGTTVMVVAALGIVVNGFAAVLLLKGRKGDLNIRGAFLHLLGDAVVSVGVVAAGAVIYFTRWFWVDPLASLIVSILIVWGTWSMLRESLRLSLNAVPENIDKVKVEDCLRTLPGVTEVHDLHIWAMSTTETALTAHLVRPGAALEDGFLTSAEDALEQRFGIKHATLQVEAGDRVCRLAPAHVV